MITNHFRMLTENLKTGVYRLPLEGGVHLTGDNGYITGVVYMDSVGNMHFVAPNWVQPAMVASPDPTLGRLEPITRRILTDLGRRLVFMGKGRSDDGDLL